MANLIAVIILAIAAAVLWLSRKGAWSALHPVAYRAALTGTFAWTLLLALRFGARTYPGVWMGGPGLLNDIFNSSEIFWIGCYAVLLAVMADGLIFVFARPSAALHGTRSLVVRIATIIRNVSLLLASILVIYGFYFAIALERLPS